MGLLEKGLCRGLSASPSNPAFRRGSVTKEAFIPVALSGQLPVKIRYTYEGTPIFFNKFPASFLPPSILPSLSFSPSFLSLFLPIFSPIA